MDKVKKDSFNAVDLLGYMIAWEIVDVKIHKFEILQRGNYQKKPEKSYWPIRVHYAGTFKFVTSLPLARQTTYSDKSFDRELAFMFFQDDFGEWKVERLPD